MNVNRTTISPTIMRYRTPGVTVTYVLGRQGKHVWLIARQLPMKAGWWDAPLTLWDLAKTIYIFCQNLIFMQSLIHKVSFCLANVFFPQKYLVVTDNLWLWTDIAVKCAWLFSLISWWHQKIMHSHVTLLMEEYAFPKAIHSCFSCWLE